MNQTGKNKKKTRVMIVDDDRIFRRLAEEVILDAGFDAVSEENGLLGWNRLDTGEKIDMAVLDVNMPEMDGSELLGKIRNDERFKDMPVLMLTVRELNEDQIAGYEHGADDYLTKPFDNDILTARIKALERRILGRGLEDWQRKGERQDEKSRRGLKS